MVNRSKICSVVLAVSGIFTVTAMCGSEITHEGAPVVWYQFNKKSGVSVTDRSGNHNDGVIVGPYTWDNTGSGLRFDGSSYVRVPSSSSLQLSRTFSLVTWFSGKGSPLHFVEHPGDEDLHRADGLDHLGLVAEHSRKGPPFFQVCGDELYFIYNVDIRNAEFGNLWSPLWLGHIAANLDSWDDHYAVAFGHEPKLQVTPEGVYTEAFAEDGIGIWQIWTGTVARDLTNFRTRQQTFRPSLFGIDDDGVEQEVRIQVVGGRIYYAFPEKNEHNQWQLFTAVAKRDGSDFKVTQRTTSGGWITDFQVAGDAIYYAYPHGSGSSEYSFAKTDLDGNHWREIAHLTDNATDFAPITVDKDRVFFSYVKRLAVDKEQLIIGSMNLDGRDIHAFETPVTSLWLWPGQIQAVGDRIYASIGSQLSDSVPTLVSLRRDGSDWKVEQAPEKKRFVTSTFAMVGGKAYYGVSVDTRSPMLHMKSTVSLGTSGANVISKGASFGVGLTDSSEVAAFINAGQDYLYRSTAPLDTGGATSRFQLSDDKLHQIALVYDGNELKLYTDGHLVSTTPYTNPAGNNDFPLLVGDGLVGNIYDVRIFNVALPEADIKTLYEEGRKRGF